jgi:hypothetical protein
MALARKCGRSPVHLGNTRKRQRFRGCQSPLRAAADYFHRQLCLALVTDEGGEEGWLVVLGCGGCGFRGGRHLQPRRRDRG